MDYINDQALPLKLNLIKFFIIKNVLGICAVHGVRVFVMRHDCTTVYS